MNNIKRLDVDFLIIGSGIVGLTLALNLKQKFPTKKVVIIEKESSLGYHSSGRNSGVLHAGFYYTPDSLKAKFTRQGNEELTKYCEKKGLKINRCGKVVVAKNEQELDTLNELKRRGDKNSVELYLIDEKQLKEIEPNAKTYKYALWSPRTSTVDPQEVLNSIKEDLVNLGVEFYFNTPYKKKLDDNSIMAGNYIFSTGKIINTAGLYADRIAKEFGFGEKYVIMPFKGIYVEHTGE
ncbi:MAG: NAD(P)/FAD-dependent oxidoreductase, partial [Sulfurihydrogenibium azorense]